MGLSIWHLLMILLIVTVAFGTKRLGIIGTDFGKAIRGFKYALREGEEAEPGMTKAENTGKGRLIGARTNGRDKKYASS
jgi:sec-independent protein translocase protein TatA